MYVRHIKYVHTLYQASENIDHFLPKIISGNYAEEVSDCEISLNQVFALVSEHLMHYYACLQSCVKVGKRFYMNTNENHSRSSSIVYSYTRSNISRLDAPFGNKRLVYC